jgi:hypothetical protein
MIINLRAGLGDKATHHFIISTVMVCFQDATRFIAFQSLFTLVYIPLVSSRKWSARMIWFLDWFAQYLLALKLTFITRTIMDTLSVGMWPTNAGTQFWLILSGSIFFLSLIRMLMTSTLETTIAIISFFFGLSFFGPVWHSIETVTRRVWHSAFGSELSDTGTTIVGLTLVVILILMMVAVHWKGWVHTLAIGALITLDIVTSWHLVVYNVHWAATSDWLATTICCSLPDASDVSKDVDGNLCPLRFTWFDCAVLLLALLFFIPLQFYRRLQCTPLWCCCRDRANALERYRRQGDEPMYGFAETYKLIPDDDDDGDDDDGSPGDGGDGAIRLSPEPYDRHSVSKRWMSPQ